jgi:hypothetical protein
VEICSVGGVGSMSSLKQVPLVSLADKFAQSAKTFKNKMKMSCHQYCGRGSMEASGTTA